MGSCKSKSRSIRDLYISPESSLKHIDLEKLEIVLKEDEWITKQDSSWNDNFVELISMLEYPLTNEEYLRGLRQRIDSFLNIVSYSKKLRMMEKQCIIRAFENEYRTLFMTRFLVERPSRRQIVPLPSSFTARDLSQDQYRHSI
jgi:hypothetical protein